MTPEEIERWDRIVDEEARGYTPSRRADGTEVPRHIGWPRDEVSQQPLCAVARAVEHGVPEAERDWHGLFIRNIRPWPQDGLSYAFAHRDGPYATNCPECRAQACA